MHIPHLQIDCSCTFFCTLYTTLKNYIMKNLTASVVTGLFLSTVPLTLHAQQKGTVTDFDGNVYQTIVIGEQEWMVENLRTTHYADGTPLVDGTGVGNIAEDYTTKYYFWHQDDPANAETYGALYTWAAVMNGEASSDANPSGVQGICPTGWHVPSDEEWKQLEIALGMSRAEADATGWRGTHQGSNLAGNAVLWNDGPLETHSEFGTSGFMALPGGYRDLYGAFNHMGNFTRFWSSTEGSNPSYAWYRSLFYHNSGVYRTNYNKDYGLSVRCVRCIEENSPTEPIPPLENEQ